MAAVLLEGPREHWSSLCPDSEATLEESPGSFAPGRFSRIAVDDDGKALDRIGGMPQYGSRFWEQHPWALNARHQRQGVGGVLVTAFEHQVLCWLSA
jgi:hypothetical protein